jgi:hypothetical protein
MMSKLACSRGRSPAIEYIPALPSPLHRKPDPRTGKGLKMEEAMEKAREAA